MKLTLILSMILSLGQARAIDMEPIKYTDSEGKIFSEIESRKIDDISSSLLNKNKIYVPNFEKKVDFNSAVRVLRDDKTSVNLFLNPEDRVMIDMCYQYPLRIVLDKKMDEKIKAVYLGDDKMITSVKNEASKDEDVRSVLIKMLLPIDDPDQRYPTNVYIERESDNKSYRFDINLVKCPDSGIIDFPQEIIINKKAVFTGQSDIIPSEDLIIKLTKGYPRKSKENVVDIHDGTPTVNSDFINLGLSVLILDDKRKNAKFELVVLNSLQNSVIGSSSTLLPDSTRVMSSRAKKPVLRFSVNLNVGKRYAMEWNYVYMLLIDHEGQYYQTIKVPLKELYKKKTLESYDLNIN